MHVEVTFRNLKPRDEVRRRVEALYEKLTRFLDPAAEGRVTLTTEHGVTIVEIIVSSHGNTYRALDEDEDLRTSIDRAFHKVEESLRRAKDRRVDRRHRTKPESDGFGGPTDADDELAEESV